MDDILDQLRERKLTKEDYEGALACFPWLLPLSYLIDKIFYTSPELFSELSKGVPSVDEDSPYSKDFICLALVNLVFYGYYENIFYCESLEKDCEINLALNYLFIRLRLDYMTIYNFQRQNAKHLVFLCEEINKKVRSSEFLVGKIIPLDGTKLKESVDSACYDVFSLVKKVKAKTYQMPYYLERLSNDKERNNRYKLTTEVYQIEMEEHLKFLEEHKREKEEHLKYVKKMTEKIESLKNEISKQKTRIKQLKKRKIN